MHRELYRNTGGLLLVIAALIVTGFYTAPATALPQFARQTQNDCATCHFQHFPKLRPFGRLFKATGLSLSAQPEIEGKDLSIPAYLNASFYTKFKYQHTSDAAVTRKGSMTIPDEGSIFVGGRLAEGIGGIVEWGGPLLSAKLIFTREMGAAGRMGMSVFTTDALGPGYGFEVMNTGAVRNHNPFEQATKVTLGNVDNMELATAATGFTLFGFVPGTGYVTATLYAPDSNEAGLTNMDTGTSLSQYFRAVYMPQVRGWDVGVGAGLYTGATKATIADSNFATRCTLVAANDVCTINTRARFVDAQAQGELNGHDLGVYFMFAQGDDPGTKTGEINLFGGSAGDSRPKGWGVDAEYSMTRQLHLLGSVGLSDNGGAGNKKMAGVGLYWQIAQNIDLQPMFEISRGSQGVDSKGDPIDLATLTLEANF